MVGKIPYQIQYWPLLSVRSFCHTHSGTNHEHMEGGGVRGKLWGKNYGLPSWKKETNEQPLVCEKLCIAKEKTYRNQIPCPISLPYH